MGLMYAKLYKKLAGFILSRYVKFGTDIVLIVATSYLMIKKFFDFSVSGWLLNNILHQGGVNIYVYMSGVVLILVTILKVLIVIFDNFPPQKHSVVEPEEVSACLQSMNSEIRAHILKCDEGKTDITKLSEQHSFDINMRLITESLAEHIRKSISSISIKRKNLFISVYTYDHEKNALVYVLHYDHKRDLVNSKTIKLSEAIYSEYECVKCMNSSNSTSYAHNIKNYAKGHAKRSKSVKHYLGCKLEANGHPMGFLNIEFHNNAVFTDEEAMQDFMEENIFPFKLLYEYQYLKLDFFNKFANFDKHWRVA